MSMESIAVGLIAGTVVLLYIGIKMLFRKR